LKHLVKFLFTYHHTVTHDDKVEPLKRHIGDLLKHQVKFLFTYHHTVTHDDKVEPLKTQNDACF